jgi:hypothetical protein
MTQSVFGKRPLLIPGCIAAAMLLAAVLPWPYGYYQLLRVVICGVGGYFAYTAHTWGKTWAVWVFGVIAVLFNPLLLVHLTREIWAVIDVVCATLFVYWMCVFNKAKENKNGGQQNAKL